MTFAVASTPQLLSSEDIAGGPGIALPATNPLETLTYTFTSSAPTVQPGVVYWSASFSSSGVAACAGMSPRTYTTPVYTLTVLPAPQPPTPAIALPPPSPLQVSIGEPGSFHLAHPSFAYHIDCTASCSGEISYRAFVLRRHRKPARAPELDGTSLHVSIAPATGGSQRFIHRYRGDALRALERILDAGGKVELRISTKLTGASGAVAQTQSTAWLRA